MRHLLCVLVVSAAVPVSVLWGEELIPNGRFTKDTAGWSFYAHSVRAKARVQWEPRDPDGCARVEVERTQAFSNVQFWAAPLTVKKGQLYRLSFQARGAKPTKLRVTFIRNSPPWGPWGPGAVVAVAEQWRTFTLLTESTRDTTDARVDFMPLDTLWLDNVSLQPAAKPENVAGQCKVRLGPGWRGKGQSILDGKPNTALRCQYHPRLPIVLELTFPAPVPIAGVRADCLEIGRHQHVGRIAVDLSLDGSDWRAFGTPRRHEVKRQGNARVVRFAASNAVCTARHVRLRVLSVRNQFALRDVEVLRADAAGTAGPEALDPVPAICTVSGRGWDYERLGYAASPSESVALHFANHGLQPVAARVEWTLADYAGNPRGRGQSEIALPAGDTGSAAVALPDGLPDGHHRIHYTLVDAGGATETGRFHFDHRRPTGPAAQRLRVIMLLDNNDPEGYGAMLLGPARSNCEIVQALPDRPQPGDVAVLMCEKLPPESDLPKRLAEFVGRGGAVLAFGKVCPELAALLPVTISDDPFVREPQRLRIVASGHPLWSGFAAQEAPAQYVLRVQPKATAQVLAQWTNGTPAVVAGQEGRVLYVAGAPGRRWSPAALPLMDELTVRALYCLAGRQEALRGVMADAAKAARAHPWQPSAAGQPGGSALNVGRFGWRMAEGLLADNLAADGTIRTIARRDGDVAFRFTAADDDLVPKVLRLDWMGKQVAWFSHGREAYRSTLCLGSPGILYESSAATVTVSAPWVRHMAWQGPKGIAHADLAADTTVEPDMRSNWLLLWQGDKEETDAPFLLVLTRPVESVRVEDGLRLRFGAEGCGAFVYARLWGVRRPAAGETSAWSQVLPAAVEEEVRFWSRALLALPVACEETFRIDGRTVRIADAFKHRVLRDAWRTPPLKLSPVPPVLALIAQHGFPAGLGRDLVRTRYATKAGPLAYAAGSRVTYELPLPCTDHYGLATLAEGLPLQEEIDHMADVGMRSTQRASGGFTSGSPFVEDMHRYSASGRKTFDAYCLELYKWCYCFPMVSGRPLYSSDIRERVDLHHRTKYWRTVNYYPHKCFVRWRREPWTHIPYLVSFVWPISYSNGVRWFVDQNESSAVILYCLWAYSQYYGDWTTASSNWHLYRQLHDYLAKIHDWAMMASSNQEFYSTVGIDMLNAEYPGNLAAARLARQVGDAAYADRCTYLAAKAMVPILARFYMPDYVASICPERDPWRGLRFFHSLSETGLRGRSDLRMRGNSESIAALAIGMYDTSKGTSPEIALLYKQLIPKRIAAYEQAVQRLCDEDETFPGWAHLMQRAMLGHDSGQLLAHARGFCRKYSKWGWQSTKGPHNLGVVCLAPRQFVLTEWAPAEYVNGKLAGDRAALEFRCETPFNCVLFAGRVARGVRVNGVALPRSAWQCDAATGRVRIDVPAGPRTLVNVAFGSAKPQRLHPYFAPVQER